ncbi:MAG: hypothetical protein J5758_02155 [Abditibacteriota bacterium]|nr:hypothetical protein [Abditibacteriota bacterium]
MKYCMIILFCVAVAACAAGCSNDAQPTAKRPAVSGSAAPTVSDLMKQGADREKQPGQNGPSKAAAKASAAEKPASQPAPPEKPDQKGQPEAAAKASAADKPASQSKAPAIKKPDIDMTTVSKTMVYSELIRVLGAPSDYLGKSIRIKGTFGIGYDTDLAGNRYYCTVTDATACCSMGLEFVPDDDLSFPSDFPYVGHTFTVTGVLEQYKNGYALVNAEFIK